MKRKNITRSALFTSIISLLLCISMLAGTTFAWFTDSVKSGINTIAAGVLDVELYHSNAAVSEQKVDATTKLFMDLQGDPILWEPGVVSYENLRVVNEGDLALAYQLAIQTANENYIVDPSGAQYGLSQILKVGVVPGGITATTRDEVVASVADAQWTTLANFLRGGALPAAGQETWGVVIYWQPGDNDNLWNLNNGKTLSSGEVLQIDLGVKLVATQEPNEFDSFSNQYDENAKAEFFPGFQGGTAAAAITADDQGVTSAEAQMAGGDVSAVVPAGVQVADGVNTLGLTVARKAASEANIQLSASEELQPLDVHMEGVAAGNTTPMLITLKHYLSTGINTGALRLYHVENGAPVAMTQVADPVNHNEFSYDPLTGDVKLALASFSEIAVVADTNNTWDGKSVAITEGDGTKDNPYIIASAGQLAYFRDEVDAGRMTNAHVKLNNNITLSNVNFDPIGWGYANTAWNSGSAAGKVFQGTFDGNGKIIFDLYQNGWELEEANKTDYTYTNCGFGLFAAASGATFKNLTISGADIKTECVEMGVLVGLSQNTCTYDNINIYNSKIANYQRPAGGLIGEVSGDGTTTITNVKIGSDVVVGTLWGDFDGPCGGVIGARWDDVGANPQIVMQNVDVGCRLDVYNDVTSAYQWHAYRRAGMLIGNTDTPAANGKTAQTATADFLTCVKDENEKETVIVHLGNWANYNYCQFTNEENPGRNYPWVRAEAGENNPAYSNPRYGHPKDTKGNSVTATHDETIHKDGDIHNMRISFAQLYGGGQGVYGATMHEGVKVIGYRYSIIYVNNDEVLSIQYVTDEMAEKTKPFIPNDEIAEAAAMNWVKTQGEEGEYENARFGGWVNAGSTLVKIPANNTENVTVYPSFETPYTARFVDTQGNVLAWCFFNEKDTDEISGAESKARELLPKQEHVVFEKWQVIDKDGNIREYVINDFKSYGDDVTVYPVFKYEGDVQLIPIDDDHDGKINYYQVGGYGASTGGQELVEIPGEVLGVFVTEINKAAFGSYDDLYAVRIPATVTTINGAAFADADKSWGVLQRETVTLYFEGTPEQWKANMDALYKNNSRYTDRNNNVDQNATTKFASNWDENMGDGSRVFFLDENGKVVNTCYWELCKVNYGFLNTSTAYIWVLHEHAYDNHEGKACDDWTSSNDKPDYVGEDRPDKEYWEGVSIS